jgi:pilus assembly protein FimV
MLMRDASCWAVFATLGVLSSGGAGAMMLGGAEGAVYIGRPLELVIPAQSDSRDGPPTCLEGELFHGETRIDPSRFQLQWMTGSQGRTGVRVRSPVAVYEPIVTLVVRLGCGQEITRRYVFLADPPPEATVAGTTTFAPSLPVVETPAARAATPAAAVPVTPPMPAAPSAQGVAPQQAEARAEPVKPARSTTRRAAATAPRAASRPAAPRAASAAPAVTAPARPRARLSLEPVEQAPKAAPAAVAASAAAAAAAASQPQSDEAAQNAQRLKALETTLAALAEQSRKRDEAMMQMTQQLKQARDERDTLGRLLALAAFVLAVMAVAWAWVKRREKQASGQWWSEHERPSRRYEPENEENDDEEDVPPRVAAAKADAAAAAVPAGMAAALAATGGDEDASRSPAQVPPAAARPEFANTFPQSPDDLDLVPRPAARGTDEELLDIRQQADFFISVGRHQHAFALLNAHASEDLETGALPWLDLLDMYQALGRTADFERVRVAFQRHFNVVVPELDAYNEHRRSLESHTKLMERIVEHWPKRRVLDIIEEGLFRRHGAADTPRLDLWSYRELLFLYQVALLLVQEDTGANVRDADVIRPAPVQEAVPTWLDDDTFHQTPVPDSELSWPEPDLRTLDIDLDEPLEAGAARAPDALLVDPELEADFDSLRAALATRPQQDPPR